MRYFILMPRTSAKKIFDSQQSMQVERHSLQRCVYSIYLQQLLFAVTKILFRTYVFDEYIQIASRYTVIGVVYSKVVIIFTARHMQLFSVWCFHNVPINSSLNMCCMYMYYECVFGKTETYLFLSRVNEHLNKKFAAVYNVCNINETGPNDSSC